MNYGFDIGGTKIEISVFDETFKEVWKKRVPTPQNNYDDFLQTITNLVLEADQKFGKEGNVGLGIPGIIDRKHGTVFTTNIEAVKNRPLMADLEAKLNRPIFANNDANCFALSEAMNDEIAKNQNVLGIILGTGLGGGLIIDGKIVEGANGCGAELGHIRLPIDAYQLIPNQPPLFLCGCGQKGCCERYLSGTGLAELYEELHHETLTAPQILDKFNQKEETAVQFVNLYLELLAVYLGNLLSILDSDVIILGGGLSNFDLLYSELPKRLPNHMLKQIKTPEIRKARYGDASGTRGAALLTQQNTIK